MLKAKYRPPSFVPFPASDPFSRAKADLGRIMFFDPRFSRSGRTACATCHQPSHGWTDGRGLAVNDAGEAMDRRTPSLIDIAWIPVLGWDGKFPDLESVTFGAITAKSNMDLSEEEALARVRADPQYTRRFAGAFPDHQVSAANMAAAIATFERLIVSIPTTPFDRWIAGDETAINPAAKKGFLLFNGRAHCAECHSGWVFSDGSFHDIGTGHGDDIGRGLYFPTSTALKYAFKTPTLRNVAERGPFMHDGSRKTLADVIDLYDQGGIARPSRDLLIRPLHLSPEEKTDLLAFLQTLSGPVSADDTPPFPIQTKNLPRQ